MAPSTPSPPHTGAQGLRQTQCETLLWGACPLQHYYLCLEGKGVLVALPRQPRVRPQAQHLAPSTKFPNSWFLLTLMSVSALVAEFSVATGPLSCLRKVTGPKPTPQLTLWGTSRLVKNFHVPHLMCLVLRTGLIFPCDRDLASRSPHLWVRTGHLARSPGPFLEPQSGAPGQGPSSPQLIPGCWHLQAPTTEEVGIYEEVCKEGELASLPWGSFFAAYRTGRVTPTPPHHLPLPPPSVVSEGWGGGGSMGGGGEARTSEAGTAQMGAGGCQRPGS